MKRKRISPIRFDLSDDEPSDTTKPIAVKGVKASRSSSSSILNEPLPGTRSQRNDEVPASALPTRKPHNRMIFRTREDELLFRREIEDYIKLRHFNLIEDAARQVQLYRGMNMPTFETALYVLKSIIPEGKFLQTIEVVTDDVVAKILGITDEVRQQWYLTLEEIRRHDKPKPRQD